MSRFLFPDSCRFVQIRFPCSEPFAPCDKALPSDYESEREKNSPSFHNEAIAFLFG